MSVTYTNRKNQTYTLCEGVTKTGKPRYFFSREAKGKLLDKIPDGYEVTESVNGIVSLSKVRPKLLREDEIESVKQALARHPNGKRYRLDVKAKEIIIYEPFGPDLDEVAGAFAKQFGFPMATNRGLNSRLEEISNIHTQYTPVMKFILEDKEKREFLVQRMCYLGSIDDWIEIDYGHPIEKLARKLIPALGTDAFYELSMGI